MIIFDFEGDGAQTFEKKNMFLALSLRVVQVVAVQDVRGVDMGGRGSKGKVPEIILASGQLSNLPSKNPSSLSAIFVQSSCYSE